MTIGSFHKRLLYFLFALSGFSALVYEILWTKYLSLSFGTTMIAVSIVAATFMGGLAIGSYLLGRYADHHTNLLQLYAFLEAGIALSALLFPPALELITQLHVAIENWTPDHPVWAHTAHCLSTALLLLPPTICMGGTFPLMCRFFARNKSGGQIGRLYALNTIGATLGTFLAGFLLIPSLGLSNTGYLAIAINLVIAVVCYRISLQPQAHTTHDVSQATRPKEPINIARNRPWLIAIGLVGFFSLAYEILWTRVFLLFLGNTTYAFSLMLSAFLVGIGIGGAVYARKVHPDLDEKKVFVFLSAGMGLSVLFTAPFYDKLPHIFQIAYEVSGTRWWHLSLLSYFLVLGVMLIPTVLSGSLLPAAVAILDPGRKRTGEGVGLVVLFNTCGAVLGSLFAGFLLIPLAGLQMGFQFLASANILMALILFRHLNASPQFNLAKTVPAYLVLAIALTLMPAPWNQNLMNSGVYYYASMITDDGGLEKSLGKYRVVEVVEDIDTTAVVKETRDGLFRFFTVNGKTDGGTGDSATQILVGQLPLLAHPNPDKALVIGLGTGITLGGVKEHPLKEIDCVEISPAVIKIADHFTTENRNALADPRVRLENHDGRELLLSQKKNYDVIISEPSNPWQSGNANLFTAEFYQLAASRLSDGGILCQWFPLYDLTTENLRIAIRTYLETFPHVLAFQVKSDLILIGRQQKINLDYLNMKKRMAAPGLREMFESIGIHSPADLVAGHYFTNQETLRAFSEKAELNTDDSPILEFAYKDNLGKDVFITNLRNNMAAISNVDSGDPLPLINLGGDMSQVAHTYRELGKSCARVGRKKEANFFMQKASEILSRLERKTNGEQPSADGQVKLEHTAGKRPG